MKIIDSSKLWFTADQHLCHKNIAEYTGRPFPDLGTMNRTIVDNYKNLITDDCIVFILGDFCFGTKAIWREYLKELPGTKILVKGNHDKKEIPADCFLAVDYMATIEVEDDEFDGGKQIIHLCHYPLVSWNCQYHGSWQLHGHCHGTFTSPHKNQLDVGVDVHDYKPISYQEVKSIITKRWMSKES